MDPQTPEMAPPAPEMDPRTLDRLLTAYAVQAMQQRADQVHTDRRRQESAAMDARRAQNRGQQHAIAQSVLGRARGTRNDAADYLRLLSGNEGAQNFAREAALPAMLLADAFLGDNAKDSRRRESIIDALTNLQGPAPRAARRAPLIATENYAYPWWYPNVSGITR